MVNRFDNIDCMIGMKEYPDKYFQLAIVDPPFGIGSYWRKEKKNGNKDKFGIKKWNEAIPNEEYFIELFRISENQVIWGGNYYTQFLYPTNSWIFWDKLRLNHTYADGELAWTSFNFSLKKYEFEWDGYRKCEDMVTIHPCQKPIQLYKKTLGDLAKQGDKILDTHVGSASSLIACEDMGFEYVGFELDKDYYEAACKRLEQFRKQFKLAI